MNTSFSFDRYDYDKRLLDLVLRAQRSAIKGSGSVITKEPLEPTSITSFTIGKYTLQVLT